MKATEARKTATTIAEKEAAKKSAELQKRRASLKLSIPKLRAKRIAEIEKHFRDHINWAVESGKRRTEITLSKDGRDHLRGLYKYLPMKLDGYDYSYHQRREKRTWHHAWGNGYLKYARWGKYVKLVLTKLRRDGFECEVVGEFVHHDDSAAYMNSGGECGSETPYYTRNTILKISW